MLSLRLVGHDGGLRRRSTAADAQIQHSGSGYIPKKADLIILDTSDLTPMAYDCIRLANTATDILKTDVGAACGQLSIARTNISGESWPK